MRNITVLVSCMNQHDTTIISRLNLQTNAIIINQCDENSCQEIHFTNKNNVECTATFINTTSRGLSNSRNLAIKSVKDSSCICLLCDEDEVLSDNYESLINEGYDYFPKADVIAFSIEWNGFGKKYSNKPYKLSYIKALKVCSVQITFKIDSIKRNTIEFDPQMGSGTGNGAGEENKFMMDCLRKRIAMAYYPNCIASIINSGIPSQWFHGFDKQYFTNFGWAARRIHSNLLLSILYIFYYSLAKHSLYKSEVSFLNAITWMLKGLLRQNNN